MRYLIILLTSVVFCFLIPNTCVAQEAGKILKAEGKIPKEFITPSSKKFKKELAALNNSKKKTSRKTKKDKKRFILESSFAIDDILQSGLVLFNDPASKYVNEVLNKLPIKDFKLKKKKPRAYILNSPAVNAFATDQGIIFVTLGLLANLENEAQLAFILSHELIHIKNKHAVNTFTRSRDIDRKGSKKDNVDQIAVDRKLFKKSLYSRKLEEEADEEGLEIFARSEYDPQAVINTFKILHYSYLPYEEIPFDLSLFEDANYRFSQKLTLDKVADLSPMKVDEDAEKRSSHPSSVKRLEKLRSSVGSTPTANKKSFILSEERFKSIQKTARYQLPFLALESENFPEAIYLSYLQLKEYPNDIALKKVIGKALYMSAKVKNYYAGDQLGTLVSDYWESVEGESQRIYHLLNKMPEDELAILALKYNWSIRKGLENDEEYQLLLSDLFLELNDHYEDLSSFSTENLPKKVEEVEEETEVEMVDQQPEVDSSRIVETIPTTINYASSKKEKIEKVNDALLYWKFSLVEEQKNSEFKTAYDAGKEAYEKRKKREAYYDTSEGLREYRQRVKKETKKGKSLGIKKLVVVNPFYLSVDARKKDAIQLLRSEEKQAYFKDAINRISKVAKLPTTLLDVGSLSRNELDKFNDIAQVNNYIGHQFEHYDMSLTPGYRQNEINAIAKKYGTDYFLWTGVISLREKNNGAWLQVGASLLLPYLLPLTLPNAIRPKYDMLYYAILFDVKTGRRSVIKMEYFDKKDSKMILNAHIYDVFHQIKKKEK